MGVFQRGNIYYIDYYASGKRVRETIGPNKKLAEKILCKRLAAVTENKHLDIRKRKKIKFSEFADQYFELHSKPNKKSWKSDIANIKRLKSSFASRYLYDITTVNVEKYKIARADQVSPATVNRELACLKHMFNKAIEWNKTDNNPVKKVKLFKENNKRTRYLEKEEIEKLLGNCSGYLKPIVIVALNTGMRKGEILSLKWHDIDFRHSIINLYETKNSEKREVPMNEMAKTALIKVRKQPNSPYVFCRANGEIIKDIRKTFFTTLKKSGIVNFRFHDLRHTFASQLVMCGIDLNTVRELMGHKTLDMTLRYSHLSPDHKKHAVDILGKNIVTIWSQAPILNKLPEVPILTTH
ncbi:MAG: site-specific integrase [Candidatus Orphnella occulta]|nr:site-specific integrase [Candidatus Orphnella occulta]